MGKKKFTRRGGIKDVPNADHILLDLRGAYGKSGICTSKTDEKSNLLLYLTGSLLPGWRLFLGKALAQPGQRHLYPQRYLGPLPLHRHHHLALPNPAHKIHIPNNQTGKEVKRMSQVFKKITPTAILSFLGICILIILMGGLFIDAIKDNANTPSYEEREDARNSQQMVTDSYGNHYFQDRITRLVGESDQQFAQRVKKAGQKIKDCGNHIIGVSGSVDEIARVWIKYNPGSPPPGYKEPSISPP